MLKQFNVSECEIKSCKPEESSPVYFYYNPDKDEVNKLVSEYKLDEHTLQSALDPDELGRLEFEAEHIAIN
jgi:magnesium transporter